MKKQINKDYYVEIEATNVRVKIRECRAVGKQETVLYSGELPFDVQDMELTKKTIAEIEKAAVALHCKRKGHEK